MNNQLDSKIETLKNNILRELEDALQKGCNEFIKKQGKAPNEYMVSPEQINDMLDLLNMQITNSIDRAKDNITKSNIANTKRALDKGTLFGKTIEEAFSCIIYNILEIQTELEENECILAGLLGIIEKECKSA